MDHVLNLVAAAQVHALGANLVAGLGRTALAAAIAATAATAATVVTAASIVFATLFVRLFAIFVEFGLFAFAHVDGIDAVIAIDLDQVGNFVLALFGTLHDVRRFVVIILFLLTQRGFFGGSLGFLREQTFAVLARNLVIIGVDFGKSQKAMAIAAIVDECCLQRRFHPGYFG